jgi:hypothetical protein
MSHPTFSARVSLLVVAVLLICGCSNKRTPVSRSEAIDGGASTLKTGLVEERTAIKTSDLQRLVDLEDIRKLHLDYAAFNETLNVDGLMGLFTDDAVLSYPEEYGGDWQGKEAIRENFIYWMKEERAPFTALYVITNPLITITGPTTAHGRWTFTNYLTDQSGSGPLTTAGGKDQPLFILGMYEDEYRKVDGAWRISRLKLTIFWPKRTFEKLVHP